MNQAACVGLDVNVWIPDFPDAVGTRANQEVEEIGLQVCRTCPVQIMCLNFALETTNFIPEGIWGGTTKLQRAALKKLGISFVTHADQIPTQQSLTHQKVRLLASA